MDEFEKQLDQALDEHLKRVSERNKRLIPKEIYDKLIPLHKRYIRLANDETVKRDMASIIKRFGSVFKRLAK